MKIIADNKKGAVPLFSKSRFFQNSSVSEVNSESIDQDVLFSRATRGCRPAEEEGLEILMERWI